MRSASCLCSLLPPPHFKLLKSSLHPWYFQLILTLEVLNLLKHSYPENKMIKSGMTFLVLSCANSYGRKNLFNIQYQTQSLIICWKTIFILSNQKHRFNQYFNEIFLYKIRIFQYLGNINFLFFQNENIELAPMTKGYK